MDKIKNFYQNTYKHQIFRDMMNVTRMFVIIMDTLIVAFLANLYINDMMNEHLFMGLMVLSTIFLYILSFRYIYKQFHIYAKEPVVTLKMNQFMMYLVIEALIFSLLLIYIYFHIKSIYV